MRALHKEYRLSIEQRQTLKMLGDAGPAGCTGAALLAYGFSIYMLTDLIRDGLAAARGETVEMGARKVTVARVWITDDGRRAIEG
jgi:hypothetical protein